MYEKIISIGCDCGPATILRDFEVRDASYPFDWMVTMSTDGIANTLIDDFAGFLDVERKTVKESNTPKYVNKYDMRFTHHSGLTTSDLQQQFNIKIARFRTSLKSNKVLLVRRLHSGETHCDETLDKLREAILTLRERYSNEHIDCLVIAACPACKHSVKEDEILKVVKTNVGDKPLKAVLKPYS